MTFSGPWSSSPRSWLIVVLGISSLLDRKLSEAAANLLLQVAVVTGLAAVRSLVLAAMLLSGTRHVAIDLGDWVEIPGHYHFSVKFVFDRLSVPLAILSFILSGTIGAFASQYMHRERGFNRFFVLYSVFVLGMVVTSLAGTIETLFAGWELVGLSSALLVAFFQERPAPARNGLWVWIVYRVSDAALLLAAVAMHHLRGEGDFDMLLGSGPWPDEHALLTSRRGPDRRTAAGGRGRGQIGAGPVLGLAAAGHGGADPLQRRLLRGAVGAPGSLPAPAGQPDPRLLADPVGDRRRPGLDRRPSSPTWREACSRTSSRRCRSPRSRRSGSSSPRSAWASATSRWSTCWATPACAPCSSSGRRRCSRTTTPSRTPSASDCRRPGCSGSACPRSRAANWLYRLALQQGYLDAFLSMYIVTPFVRTFRWFDRLEHRWTDLLAGGPSRESDQVKTQFGTIEEFS